MLIVLLSDMSVNPFDIRGPAFTSIFLIVSNGLGGYFCGEGSIYTLTTSSQWVGDLVKDIQTSCYIITIGNLDIINNIIY